MAITVLLVDDVPELRSVVRQALKLRTGFAVVAEAEDGATAIDAAARHQPEVIVLDLGLPDLAGHEVLRRLRAVSPAAQVVVYTGSYTADRVSIRHEVEAFLTKDRDVAYLVDLLARLSRPRYDSAAIDLGPAHSDVATARRFVVEQCAAWGCGDLLDDAELVVSELVTNALLHGTRHCELRAGLSDAALRLQVIDQGAGMPDPQAAGDRDEHGRGLLIVSAVCAAWGVEALPGGGKVVWAEILRPLVDPGGDDPPGRAPDDVASRLRNGDPATGDRPGRPNENRPPSTPQAVALARRRRIPPAGVI
ncbi:MAG TPA: response regulator [Acidimicrobiia bacterium]|nr:response regulator [Acidimicrobiia bacterium]